MLKLSSSKLEALKRLSDENGIIGALAIDQRGSLKKMIAAGSTPMLVMKGLFALKNWFQKN